MAMDVHTLFQKSQEELDQLFAKSPAGPTGPVGLFVSRGRP